jgi:PilZ domain
MDGSHSLTAGHRFPNTRAARRYPIVARSEAIEPLTGQRVAGQTSVISLTGCYVCATDVILAGAIVRLRIERCVTTFNTWARVANVVPGEGVGLAFLDTEQAEMDILKGWIQEVEGDARSASHEHETVIPQEIERAAEAAGFKRMPLHGAIRAVFIRGQTTLIASKNGDWACYTHACGGRRPDGDGQDFTSLLHFLQT